MVKNKLGEEEVQHSGWLLDGYPRRYVRRPACNPQDSSSRGSSSLWRAR